MAPVKTAPKSNSSGLLRFFIPRSKWLSNLEPEDEIIVASHPNRASSVDVPSPDQTRLQRGSDGLPSPTTSSLRSGHGPTPRKRGRPRKTPNDAASQNSATPSTDSNTPRKRGTLRKNESSLATDSQPSTRSSSVDPISVETLPELLQYHIDPIGDGPGDLPTHRSPHRSLSHTLNKSGTIQGNGTSTPSYAPPAQGSDTERDCSVSASEEDVALSQKLLRHQDNYFEKPAPAVSFSSAALSTSFPASSGTSGIPVSSTSSSRRIMKDGLKGVSNSDSDDSSGDDLADPASFYRPKHTSNMTAKALPVVSKYTSFSSRNTRLSDQTKKRKSVSDWPASPLRKRYKNSLANLVKDHQRDQRTQASIATLEKEVEELRQREGKIRNVQANDMMNGDALLATAGSDTEARERLAVAMERTEALQDERRFYFFRDDALSPLNHEFPIASLPDEPWSNIYLTESSRKEACISGFAAELAAQFPLPLVVTSWMGEQLLCETNELLCEAYIEIIRNSCFHHTSVSDKYASLNAIYKTRSLCDNTWSDDAPGRLPSTLEYMTRVACFCAPAADSIVPDSLPTWTTTLFLDLALMAIDENVKADLYLSLTISRHIEEVLDLLSEGAFHGLCSTAVRTFFSSREFSLQLKCRAIQALPAGTRRAYEVRRRLALECFSTATESKDSDSQNWFELIAACLKMKPEFQLSSSTDYRLLKDLIAVLDIAVSGGWTDWSTLHREKSKSSFAPPPLPSSTEKLHNQSVDLISKRLKTIWSQIKDAGATHLLRMEAKDAIGLLIKKLEHLVRTHPKPRKGAFDGQRTADAFFALTHRADSPSHASPTTSPESPAERAGVEPVATTLRGVLSEHESEPHAETRASAAPSALPPTLMPGEHDQGEFG